MWLQTLSIVVLASQLVVCQELPDRGLAASADGGADRAEPASSGAPVPPVLRPLEPPDNRFVTLPGARAAKPPRVLKPVVLSRPFVMPSPSPRPFNVPVLPVAPPIDLSRPAPESLFLPDLPAGRQPPPLESAAETHPPDPPSPPPSPAPPLTTVPAILSAPPPPEVPVPVAPSQPTPGPSAEFQSESALFLQKQIGWWTLADARALLGNPEGQRPAIDDNQAPNGQIYAFPDPTGRYKQLELDFDAENGNLRTVFVYPWNMTWQDCRRLFGANVSSTEANKGRTFYSYLNRRLDVLVDQGGQVISLGLY